MSDIAADGSLPDLRTLPYPALRVEPPWTQPTADSALTAEYLDLCSSALDRGRTEYRAGLFREVAAQAQDLLVRLRHRIDVVQDGDPQREAAARIAACAAVLVGRTRESLNDEQRAPVAYRTAVELFEHSRPGEMSARELTDYGIALTNLDRDDEAVDRLQRALDREDDMFEALRYLGLQLLRHGDLVGAEAALRRAHAALADDPRAHQLLGRVLRETGRDTEAAAEFERAAFGYLRQQRLVKAQEAFEAAVLLGPESAVVHAGHAETLRRQGRGRDALHAVELALTLDPYLAWAWACRAAALFERGDLAAALESADAALKQAPDYASAYELRGRLLRLQGRQVEAIEAFDAALEREPTLLGAYVELGAALFESGQPDRAAVVLRDGLAQAPDVPWFKALVGEALRLGGHVDEAITLLRDAVESQPSLAKASLGLADALAEKGEWAEAHALADDAVTAVAAEKTSASARRQAGLLRNLGRLHPAEAMARQAVDLKPSSVSARLELAEILDRLNRPADALDVLSHGLGLKPHDRRLLARKGRLLRAQGRFSEAIAVLREALELEPASLNVSLDLARSLWRLDNGEAALDVLDATDADDPDVRVLRAAILVSSGDPGAGLAELDAVRESTALDGFGLATSAQALHRLARTEEGEAALAEALDIGSSDVEQLGEIADALRTYGRLADSLECLDRALALAPESAWLLFVEGKALRASGDWDGAARQLERALAVEPDLAGGQAALGEVLRVRGEHSRALAALDRALQRHPDDASALASKGATLRAHRRHTQALTVLQRALELESGDWFTRVELAATFADVGEFKLALEHCEAALAMREHHWLLSLKGWALHNLFGRQRADDVLAAYRAALKWSGEQLWYGRGVGDALKLLGQHEEARAEYHRTIESAADNPNLDAQTLAQIGWCHYAAGDAEMATRVYTETLFRDPELVDTEFDLALALLACGRCQYGARQYERAFTHLQLVDPLRRRGVLGVVKLDLLEAVDDDRADDRCKKELELAVQRVHRALAASEPEVREILEGLHVFD